MIRIMLCNKNYQWLNLNVLWIRTRFQSKPCIGVKVGHFPLYSSWENASPKQLNNTKSLSIFILMNKIIAATLSNKKKYSTGFNAQILNKEIFIINPRRIIRDTSQLMRKNLKLHSLIFVYHQERDQLSNIMPLLRDFNSYM